MAGERLCALSPAISYGQSPKTKSGDEWEPHTFGGETIGGVVWIDTWPGRCVVVLPPESCVLVTLAAAAPGADAMAAATAPAPNSIAKVRGLVLILFSLIHFLLCQTIDEFVDVFSVQHSI
ncbi:hypothetical protein [Mycolicibacterium tusciae]|jgi:hypothetical protein|uniref:Uncharacterized protein n=1 Tax=Mycolicibacterium tusciae TaxID=75922 RepID=A0A1X0JK11_9MYCO|nr:hypothetical protein [Mycolicibacterium tusciae]ORB63172.1 hypothetical protein BST47_20860 [Mycolicibacterium tusciae]